MQIAATNITIPREIIAWEIPSFRINVPFTSGRISRNKSPAWIRSHAAEKFQRRFPFWANARFVSTGTTEVAALQNTFATAFFRKPLGNL
jgi:hypothetical protein